MKIKKYMTSSGLEIWVGQDDYSNDELSIRASRANDLWFHVSGVPGSHVVLRCAESGEMPGKDTIREAAELAAWFSKMRNGGNVAVHYCFAKYVKKPRGAKPGTVTIQKEKKIKVRPSLREEI